MYMREDKKKESKLKLDNFFQLGKDKSTKKSIKKYKKKYKKNIKNKSFYRKIIQYHK